MTSTALETLASINREDMLSALGAADRPGLRPLLEHLIAPAARRFARVVLDYDQTVAGQGLAGGARRVLARFHMDLRCEGVEHIPPSGPLLIVSNHPGLTDTVALFASLPRRDVKIVAADRPFLRALPATSEHLIFVSDDDDHRIETLRSITAHLRAGGAILTFPGGQIEPDPACMPGAREALENWSESIGFFARLVPSACIVPAIVSGVIAPQSLRHPLTRLRRRQKDREKLAAALQLLVANYRPQTWPVSIHICFGAPLEAGGLAELRDLRAITRRVIEHTRPLVPDFTHSPKNVV